VDDGKRQRQGPAIGLQMRRERSFDPGGHGDFEGWQGQLWPNASA
jgi:hypothetical protein